MNTPSKSTYQHSTEAADSLFGIHRDQFLRHLADRQYARATIRMHEHCICTLASMMKAKGMRLRDVDETKAADLAEYKGLRGQRRTGCVRMAGRFIRFLKANGVGRLPTTQETARAELRQGYEVYLRRQRGFTSEKSIRLCWHRAESFLNFHFGRNSFGDLSRITPLDIASYLQHLASRNPPLRDKTRATLLRNFFLYLFKAGKTSANLAVAIPRVAQNYAARLPRHLTPEQVERIIEAVRTGKHYGKRNYAMVLLLARLGLRAPEVIAMQIDDIDWRAGDIVVRGKGGRHDRMPLPPDVGEALAVYVRFDRVTKSRALFVRSRAPYGPFKDGTVLNTILRDAFQRTGLRPPVPYVGSHILRHSLATNLLRKGASLEEIGDTLRHRSRGSTMLYARMDIDGLRSIAPTWPTDGGAQ